MKSTHFLLSLSFLAVTISAQTVYLIRHGEKPADGGDGLNTQGLERAQCLRTVFGANSTYNIGYIIAEQPKSNEQRARPLETVQPLATDLGLTVDTSCDRDDQDCVANLVRTWDTNGNRTENGTASNVLICWEHDNLTPIVEALGDSDAPTYPDDAFNIIWTDPSPYGNITAVTSENCPGLDSS